MLEKGEGLKNKAGPWKKTLLCECVRACENAQCVQLFNYLMHKNTLTVVLNGVKEWKVHGELWTGPEERGGMEARKQEEKKEKEKIILVERETNRKKKWTY